VQAVFGTAMALCNRQGVKAALRLSQVKEKLRRREAQTFRLLLCLDARPHRLTLLQKREHTAAPAILPSWFAPASGPIRMMIDAEVVGMIAFLMI